MKPRREHLVNFYPLKSPSPSYANGLPIISRCFYFLFFFSCSNRFERLHAMGENETSEKQNFDT